MLSLDRNTQRPAAGPGAALKLLADATRLRILGVLERQELSVGELSRALDLSQSRVSNHLRLLREAGMLGERHVGTSTYLRLAPAGEAVAARLWAVVSAELPHLPQHAADLVRLEAVLAERAGSAGFFERLAGDWDKRAGAFATGRGRERACAQLLPAGMSVADLGCGTGYLAASLLGNVARLVCVDRSPAMLAEAEKRLSRHDRGTTLEFREGELDRLPLDDGELDGVTCGMVLHHLPELDPAFGEMARVLKPGGTAVVLELAPHREAWMRRDLGDRHLGLAPEEILAAFERAGFVDAAVDPVEDHYRPRRSDAAPGDETPSLSLYVVRARKPRT